MDLTDPELREQLAEAAYYRDRQMDVALDREHEMDDDTVYMAIAWQNVSAEVQRPYRLAVEMSLDWAVEHA